MSTWLFISSETKVKLREGFRESASLPLPGIAQREGSGFRDANEQFDWIKDRLSHQRK